MNIKDSKSSISVHCSNTFNKVSNRTYFLLLVFSIFIQLLHFWDHVISPQTQEWCTQELTMNYTYGFIRRGLLGSFTYLIQNAFNIDFLYAVRIVQGLGMILFTTSLLIFLWQLLKDKQNKSFCFVALALISLNLWGFHFKLYCLLDTYTFFLTILMVYLILSDKALFLIPLFAGLCELIHEGYPMMFFGIIMSLIVYRFCYADNKNRIKYACVFIITGLVVSVLFCYSYMLHPRIENPDIELILANCRALLKNETLDTSNIRFIWLDSTIISGSQHANSVLWVTGKPTEWFFKLMRIPLLNVVITSPLIFMTARFWIKIIKYEQIKLRKFLLVLCGSLVFLTLPLIIFHTDQARWFYDIVLFEVIVIGAICLKNANNERDALSSITKLTLPKMLLLVFYYVFYWNPYISFLSQFMLPSIFGWSSIFYNG